MKRSNRLTGIELRHLAALETVAETGSFAAAARRLGYTQSAISQQIATLERAAGMSLLDRPGGRRPVQVTEAGERLLRHSARATAAMRAAEADLRALAAGEAGSIHVGTFPSVGVRLLPRVIRLFGTRRPGVDVRLTEAYHADLVDGVLDGRLELAFLSGPPDPELDVVELLVDPYVLLAPVGSELALRGTRVSLRELADLPFVSYRTPEDSAEPYLRSRGVEPEIVFRSDESGIVQGLVGAGIGYALVPLLTVDTRDAAVATLEVRSVPPREVVLAWHGDRTLSPGAEAFIEIVREVAEDVAPPP